MKRPTYSKRNIFLIFLVSKPIFQCFQNASSIWTIAYFRFNTINKKSNLCRFLCDPSELLTVALQTTHLKFFVVLLKYISKLPKVKNQAIFEFSVAFYISWPRKRKSPMNFCGGGKIFSKICTSIFTSRSF